MRTSLFLICTLAAAAAHAQEDTTRLNEVTVQGYGQQRLLTEVPAAVNYVGQRDLLRFAPTSVLPAVNSMPGVRMEERSPGSYRLNVRGSSLRSPFGVRNVKMYYNGIPFTDPGGNTYLNQFGAGSFSSLEILKGPGSSLYGAGTGGVLLAGSGRPGNNGFSAGYTGGSFGSHLAQASVEAAGQRIYYSWQEANGYRQHTYMQRTVAGWSGHWQPSSKGVLEAHLLYGNLRYQTPGGLTPEQYATDARQARPAAGAFPSAAESRAAIYQQTIWGGLQYQHTWNEQWKNATAVYGAYSQVKNPSIRNYERRTEPHFGGRTVFTYQRQWLKVLAGGELQQGYFNTSVYGNKGGQQDTLQTDDDINNRNISLFLQPEVVLQGGWTITAGISLNNTAMHFARQSDNPVFHFTSRFRNEWAPRLAVMKQFHPAANVYAVVSKGFSPPTVAEVLPSTSVINTTLQAEKGWNYELGARGGAGPFWYDVSLFYFGLKDAIVQRRDASGADYFENAGATVQQGVETFVSYRLRRLKLRVAYTYNHFRYKDFVQVDKNYDGNTLPGTPKHALAAGVDVELARRLYLYATYTYNDDLFLNDANTDKAAGFHLLGCKVSYTHTFGKTALMFHAGGDNLLNVQYSLGNDINAAARRYFNVAAGRSWYAGVTVRGAFRGKE
ncbi:TonB-dependent receptor [Chitinophaga alhagiae]|uniref:TonB-dependent receptor n=1 Tax=Chitinophaga alhagiae TaxID=2203219 RepID=A0ABN5LLB2_9BACT|nr:TonB-dependent receptor [Chitinophaga alhagiae]AWO00213.1 TonB-dependent receptor [Chitinophaga alhagiae]